MGYLVPSLTETKIETNDETYFISEAKNILISSHSRFYERNEIVMYKDIQLIIHSNILS